MIVLKKKLAVVSILTLGLLSCNNELVEVETVPKVYQASVESFDYRTRTQLGTDNSVVWSSDDCILVYEGSDTGMPYILQSSYAGSSVGKFALMDSDGVVNGGGESFNGTLAVYPYGENLSLDVHDGGVCAVSGLRFSPEQAYLQESFANESFPIIAYSTEGNNVLPFKNVGGALKLTLTGDYSVSKIMLTGKSGEKISGDAVVTVSGDGIPSVKMGDDAYESITLVCDPPVQLDPVNGTAFFFSLPPTDFVTGFKAVITDTDGYKDVKETNARNVVYRSKILVMPAISSELAEPFCETGEAFDISKTTASITCTFTNIPDGAKCGLKLIWNDGEKLVPVNNPEECPTVELSDLKPGTLYSYWAYIDYGGNIIEGPEMQFKTDSMEVYGIWTCVETSADGTENAYTFNLLEDGTAVLNTSNNYESASWNYTGSELEVKFAYYGNSTYSTLTLNVDIDSSGMYGSGKSVLVSGSYYSTAESRKEYDVTITRNMDRCTTEEAVSTTELTAILGCSFKYLPSGSICGVIVSDGKNKKKYPASSSENYQEIKVSDLIPGTSYTYWAYCEFDGKHIMGEVKDFQTEPVNVSGIWTCQETYSSGTTKAYTVALYEDGKAELLDGASSYEYCDWSCTGTILTVNFSRLTSSNGIGLSLQVDIDMYSTPMCGRGSADSWAENWNTGGSSHSIKDLVMTKNGDVCSTGEAFNITVASATINCGYSSIPSYAECGVVLSANGKTQTYYAAASDGCQTMEASDLEPNTTYRYWAFAEFDGMYIKGEIKEFTTLAMDLQGVWRCTETDSSGNVKTYTVELYADGKATINKADFQYESAGWSSKGRELNIGITILTPPVQVSGGTYISDGLQVLIEDPYNPVYGVGNADREVWNTDTLGGSNYYRKLEMTKL